MINWKNGFLKEFGIIQYSSLEVGNMLKLFEVPPSITGADPGFFLGGGALVCCSTSTPINHMVFLFLQNTSCIRKRQVISGGGGGCTPCTLYYMQWQMAGRPLISKSGSGTDMTEREEMKIADFL